MWKIKITAFQQDINERLHTVRLEKITVTMQILWGLCHQDYQQEEKINMTVLDIDLKEVLLKGCSYFLTAKYLNFL